MASAPIFRASSASLPPPYSPALALGNNAMNKQINKDTIHRIKIGETYPLDNKASMLFHFLSTINTSARVISVNAIKPSKPPYLYTCPKDVIVIDVAIHSHRGPKFINENFFNVKCVG